MDTGKSYQRSLSPICMIWNQNQLFNNPDSADNFLGYLDAIFMAVYAAGLYVIGCLGDRCDPRTLISIGMCGTGITLLYFGSFTEWLPLYNIPFYIITYILFALFQSFGWPNEVAIMSNWFGKQNRGLILGLWSSCQPVGNIFGGAIVSVCLPFGTDIAFLVQASLIFAGGFIFFLGIVSEPAEMGYENTEISPRNAPNKPKPPPVGFIRALLIPGVLAYCVCNSCLKLVNYAFFFWLPFYLHKTYGWEEAEADRLSLWYDFGGIVGSVVGGVLSDRLGYRTPVIVAMLTGSLFALYGYSETSSNQIVNASVMSVLGALINGPYNLIVSTISADLGSHPKLAANAKAMATVTGLIDGTGSFGSAIGQVIVPQIDHRLGWDYVFYLFIIMNLLSLLSLVHRFVNDCRRIFRGKRGCCKGTVNNQ